MTPNTAPQGAIIVSGGSRGLGLEIVEHLLARGCRVATFARRATKDTERLAASHAESFRFRAIDATDTAAAGRYFTEVANNFGGIAGLVNNAAVGQDDLLVHASADKIRQIIDINLTATILLTRLVLKEMMLQPTGGRIVSISSICGSRGYPGLTAYAATKGGLDAFTRSLAREVGEKGILVNAIGPGFFESEMSSVLTPEQLNVIRRRTPTGKLTLGEQVLPVLDMLLFSDTNIHGQVIFVDGGTTI